MKNNKVIVFGILLTSLITSFFIFSQISLGQLTFWDEGGYLWQAYVLRHALLEQGLKGLWNASRQEVYYPFLQSWYYILTSSFLGFSIESLRLANVFLFVPSTILIWFISNELIQKKTFFKLIPTFLFITSPMMIFFFSNAMKEGFGITLTLLSLWLYFQARRREKNYLFLLTSLTLLALFFTKYNYGVLVIAAITFESVIWSVAQISKPKVWLSQLSLFGPLTLGFIFWSFFPYKNFQTIWIVLQNKFQVNFNDTTPLGHALYYPLEVAFSYLLNPWLMTLAGFGFLWSFKKWKDWKVRVLAFLFLLNLALGVKNMSNNQARFIFTSLPGFFLLAGLGMSIFYEDFKKILQKNDYLKGFLLLILLLTSFVIFRELVNFPSRVKSVASHQIGSTGFYEKNYQQDSRFDFNLDNWPKDIPLKEELKGQKVDDIFEFIFESTDPSGNYILVAPLNEFSPGLLDTKIALRRDSLNIKRINAGLNYYLVLEVLPGSHFDNKDYRLNFQFAKVQETLQNKNLTPVAEKLFPYLGLKITILTSNLDKPYSL